MDARGTQIGRHHLKCVPVNNCFIAEFRNLRIIKARFYSEPEIYVIGSHVVVNPL